jgi:hypothetical protein
MRLNIRGKLLVLFFAMAILPMLAVGLVSYYNSVRAVEAGVEQRSMAVVQEGVAAALALFSQRRIEMVLLARNQEIQDLYARRAALGKEERVAPRLQTFFAQFFTDERQLFAQVYYLDLEGDVLLKCARRLENQEITEGQPMLGGYGCGTEDTELEDFDAAAHTSQQGIFLVNAHSSDYGPVLRLGRWIENVESEKRIGLVLADLQVDRLLQKTALAPPDPQSAPRRPGPDMLSQVAVVERDHQRLIFLPQNILIIGQQFRHCSFAPIKIYDVGVYNLL